MMSETFDSFKDYVASLKDGCVVPLLILLFFILTDRYRARQVAIQRQFGAGLLLYPGRYVRGSLPASSINAEMMIGSTLAELILINEELMEIARIPWDSVQEIHMGEEPTLLILTWNDESRGPQEAVFATSKRRAAGLAATLNHQQKKVRGQAGRPQSTSR